MFLVSMVFLFLSALTAYGSFVTLKMSGQHDDQTGEMILSAPVSVILLLGGVALTAMFFVSSVSVF